MHLPWQKAEPKQQLDLLDDPPASEAPANVPRPQAKATSLPASGIPRKVVTSQIDEDPANPRTEFPDAKLDELADDIRHRGILEALVVHPVNGQGRYLLHFGAMRLRAALRAGLEEVPVVIRDAPADPYAQVAENLKRHSLSPLDLARFIRSRVDADELQTTIAKRLCMNLTTVRHHHSLLELPPVLDDALKAGRCTSPRTLHELSKLHEDRPGQVQLLVEGPGGITREAVALLRDRVDRPAALSSTKLIAQATAACDRLERLLGRIKPLAHEAAGADLSALRAKVAALSSSWPPGSDGQTSSADPS